MRRQFIAVSLIALTALMPLSGQAYAQFELSPRGLLGVMTRPLRGLLGHFRYRAPRHHRAAPAVRAKQGEARSAEVEKQAVQNAGPAAMGRRNPYEAILGYAFWPGDDGQAFERFGFGTIAMAVAGQPLAPAAATVGSGRRIAAVSQNAGSTEFLQQDGLVPCDLADASAGDWLRGQIDSKLRPDPSQLRAFDALRTDLVAGSKLIRSQCRASNADTPLERLAELKRRIWAIHDAGLLARPAVRTFYDSLDEKQKAALDPPAKRGGDNATASPMGQLDQDCAAQSIGSTQRLIQTIEKTVQPTRAQQAGIQALQKTSAQMEKLLLAPCAQPAGKTPLARLDAADDRLVAINFATSNMEIALNNFYSSLDNEQKARFDALGR